MDGKEKTVRDIAPEIRRRYIEGGGYVYKPPQTFVRCACPSYGPAPVITINEASEVYGQIWDTSPGLVGTSIEHFKEAMEHELEHGCRRPETNVTCDDLFATGLIALAHLLEDPMYYEKLKKAGLG